MAEHKDLPEAQLHEVKGASTAIAGEVLTADGLGESFWQQLKETNTKIVTSVTDFPTPIGDATTLLANTTYIISGDVSMGNVRIVMSDGSGLYSVNRFANSLTYTGTGAMITTDKSSLIEGLFLSATSGSVLSLLAVGGQTTFIITNCFSVSSTIGTIAAGWNVVFRSFSPISAPSDGLVFTGAQTSFNMTNSLWNGIVGTGIDLGAATFSRVQILSGNRFDIASGSTGISGLASSGNINVGGFGAINGTIFEGVGTHLNNITDHDVRWDLSGNPGVGDTLREASGAAEGNASTTSTTTTASKVNVGTLFVAGLEEQFTVATNGRVTYVGTKPFTAAVAANLLWNNGAGTNVAYKFYIAVNDTFIPASVSEGEFDTADPLAISLTALTPLVTNDYIEVFVKTVTGTGNDICRTMNILVR